MAHSTATLTTAAAATTGEINYFYQDEHGKILKVLKQADIKQESIVDKGVYTNSAANGSRSSGIGTTNRMGAFSQMNSANQGQYVRLQNNYNPPVKTENPSYTVVTPQSSNADMYDSIKGDRYGSKYTQNSNIKIKSKLNAIQSSTTHSTSSTSVQRKRKPDKAGKGLRHFSMKVCEKVKEKRKTTYNEVADELVNEEILNNSFDTNCDQKNIRRRVYDALNVLMAMHIISKDKKEIRWIGLPTNSVEQCSTLEKENEEMRERIDQKHQQLRELTLQLVAFKSLIERNKQAERQGIVPTPNSSIQLPFIIVNTYKSTKINCSVTNDKSEYIFKFDDKFEMHDDIEVLKRMGLLFGLDKGQCSPEDIERAKSLVPPNIAKYIEAYGKGVPICDMDADDQTKAYMQQLSTKDSQDCYAGTHTDDDVNKSHDLDDEDEYSDID